MFERALVFINPESPNEALLPAVERLVPGTAVVFELRTIPARAGWSEPRRPPMGRGPSAVPSPGLGSSRRILKRTTDPARSILEIVDELGIDLVALGDATGGRKPFRSSEVAEKVIASGQVPVLLVGTDYVPPAPDLRRVLLPFDPFVPPRSLLQMAGQLSRRSHAEIVVLGLISVSVEPQDTGIIFEDGPLRHTSAEERISDFARDLVDLGCRVRTVHAYEEPLDVIPRYARSLDVDMVLLGKVGYGPQSQRRISGLSRQLAVSVECPLLFGALGGRNRWRTAWAG
jgi:nucleotide-binding universal stress UspA family protein